LELIELKANIRNSTGKGQARALRRAEKIPAVLYGPGTEPVLLSVEINDLEKSIKKEYRKSGSFESNYPQWRKYLQDRHDQGIADPSGFTKLSTY